MPNYTSVDQKEMERFDKESKDWWDPYGSWAVLHRMNKYRLSLIGDALKSTGYLRDNDVQLTDLKIMDVGCGGGILSEALATEFGRVVAIDPCGKLIQIANDHLLTQDAKIRDRVRYFVETIEDHSVKNANSYDVIIASEVAEHVTDKESFIKHCVLCLKPGGSLILTTVNRTIFTYIAYKIFGEYILRILPVGTHEFSKFVTPQEIITILKDTKCKIEEVDGNFYHFYWWPKTWTRCYWTKLGYSIHAVKNY